MKTRTARAFTLIELLLAMGITSLIVVAMLRLFTDSTTLWQRNDQKLDTFREARAALQFMARDFSGLRPERKTPDNYPLLALDVHGDTQKPEDLVNQEIYAVTGVRNPGSSDLCAIGYYCVWVPKKNAFVLTRQCTNSATTFNLLRQTLSATSVKTGMEAFDTIFSRTLNTKENKVQTFEELATYVWDLKVEIPDMTQPPKSYTWPQGNFSQELPAWVEIRFKALGVNAARRIAGSGVTRDTWFQPDSDLYRHLILPGQQEFVTRIKLCR